MSNNILSLQNPEIIISLSSPYTNIKKILSYEDILLHNSISFDLNKFFRFSYNNINYSNWIDLTNESLRLISIPMLSDFWIEYKYELNEIEYGESIEFKSIALEILYNNSSVITKKNCKISNVSNCCNSKSNSIINNSCTNNLFNPYDIANALNVYEPLVKLTSNIFGFDVEYYKTNPKLNSKDIILNEYSIYNLEKKCNIKVLIPDNALPTKELQFNSQDGITLPDMFEIHIVRSVFEDSFGIGEIPRIKDYLYFKYLKRVYQVNSVMIADENPFNTANYYKVNLTDYAQRINILDEESINSDIENITTSYEELFGDQMKATIEDVTKPEQYVTLNKQKNGDDIIRSYIDPKVIIREHNLINANTYQVISNFYYDFTKCIKDSNVITYNYSDGLPNVFSMSYALQMQKQLAIKLVNINIKLIEDSTGTYTNDYYNSGILLETLEPHGLEDNDIFYIKNSNYYNGINIVSKKINSNKIIIDKTYKGFNGGIISKQYEKQEIINYSNLFSIIFVNENIIFKINEKILIYQVSYPIGKWFYSIINLSNDFKQAALYLYDENLIKIFSKVNLLDSLDLLKNSISIKAGSYYLTNFRLFKKNIEEEQHISILSQNIILDDSLTMVIDNALPQVRLKHYSNSR